jgi:hypothetical protein
MHRLKLPALLLKLDVARAFDSVSLPFLLSVLRQRGFGPRWLRWIAMLLRTAGSAGAAFRHGRGLRQGDPLSPLLFVLVMDVVAAMFRAAEAAGMLPQLPAGIQHRVSLYADDVVVFARPSTLELQAIKGVLDCFEQASGLHVNFLKSAAAPIHYTQEVVDAISTTIDCPI